MKTTRAQELEQFLKDALAYMRFCATQPDITAEQQLLTLAHDIGGLARQEPCFRPRVSGYHTAAMGFHALKH